MPTYGVLNHNRYIHNTTLTPKVQRTLQKSRQKDRDRKTERQRKAEFRVSFNSTYALNQPQTYTNPCVQFRKSKVQCSPMVQASNPKATRVVTFKTRVLQL